MSETITLSELLPNEFKCNEDGKLVAEVELKKLNMIVDILTNYYNEIERLQKEIKEYQEELEKADSITQSCIFEGKEEATMSFRECLNHLERLHSIIKEVREDIKYCIPVLEQEEEMSTDERSRKETGELKEILQKSLEILDKENIE